MNVSSRLLSLDSSLKFKSQESLIEKDVDFIYTVIREDHPGMCNSLDPDFSDRLDEIFLRTKSLLASSKSIQEQKQIARDFGREFQDSHLFVSYFQNEDERKCHDCSEKSFGMSFPRKDIVWIDIPTFQPNSEQKIHLQSIIEACRGFRTHTVVFDIRGNGGGNSTWGSEILESLFGKKHAQACKQKMFEKVFVEWRASPGNLEHVKNFPSILARQFGSDHSSLKWAEEVIFGLQSAVDNGQKYYSQLDRDGVEESSATECGDGNLFRGNIFVVVDRFVGSASLDFLDGLKAMHKTVKLVGETTGKDSCYMELRQVSLPSSEGVFGFPIKVYRNRPRGHNEPYHPDISCMEIMSEEAKLKDFVLTLL